MSGIRCPGCGKFGSPKLGGYCQLCAPKPPASDKIFKDGRWARKSYIQPTRVLRPTLHNFGEYPIVKKTFGLQERKVDE